jgi:ABC-type phosphate transport system substrate-binding protein
MRTSPTIAMLLVLALAAFGTTIHAQGEEPSARRYQVIVHPGNATNSVDRHFLEDSFLKKLAMWPGGEVILPADMASNSNVRGQFTKDVLKRTVGAVKSYWQQRIFAGGDLPPPEFDTDDDVVRYVLQHKGAVGYVSGTAKLQGSRVVTVTW